MNALPYLTDAEVDDICAGLQQHAAKIKFLRRLGYRVDRKPNGRPLAWRDAPPVQSEPPREASVVTELQGWAAARKARHGQKTQGR